MNILVCGRMKEGKTTFALWLARNWNPANNPQHGGTVIWDPRHMVDEEMSQNAGFSSVVYAYSGQDLEEQISEYQSGSLIVYRPSSMDPEQDFRELCAVMLDPPEKYYNWSLVVDEAAQLQSSHTIIPELSRTVRQHPRSVLIVQTTHSLQDWHRASRDLNNHLFCFRLVGRSLHAVVDFCDGSEEMEETIKNLPPHHLIHISFESQAGAEEFVLVRPESWFCGRVDPDDDEEEEDDDDQEEEEDEEEFSDT